MVFFEAPHRIRAMLKDLKDIFEDRQIVLIREQTKLHEEVIRGSADILLGRLKGNKLKGEFTLVVSGRGEEKGAPLLDEEIRKKIESHLKEGKMSLRDIAKHISEETGLTYRTVYREGIMIKKEMVDSRQQVGKTPGHGDHKKVSHK